MKNGEICERDLRTARTEVMVQVSVGCALCTLIKEAAQTDN